MGVLEAVSNVEKNEPSGVREVAIEYAFAHVTKFALMRKEGTCNLRKPSEGNAVDWARKRINVHQNALAKTYATVDSFLSVGFTKARAAGYNDNPKNEPKAYYCSQIVAWMLYQQGCAFHPGTNLNV